MLEVQAPLLIGCDLNNISKDTLSILGNKALISINQDSLGTQARRVWSDAAATPLSSVDALLQPCKDGSSSQAWRTDSHGHIQSLHGSNRCLGLSECVLFPWGTQVDVFNCDDPTTGECIGAGQRWWIRPDGTIRDNSTGSCLSVQPNAPYVSIVQLPCETTTDDSAPAYQSWTWNGSQLQSSAVPPTAAGSDAAWCLTAHDTVPAGDTAEVWAGPLANGDSVLAFVNRGSGATTIKVNFSDLGLGSASKVSGRTYVFCSATISRWVALFSCMTAVPAGRVDRRNKRSNEQRGLLSAIEVAHCHCLSRNAAVIRD